MRGVLSGAGAIINLAAEHRDDVRPLSKYHETNVEGALQVCKAAREAGIQTLIFTSSVAVYGFNSIPMGEEGPFNPFNPYGETKLLAEGVYRSWADEDVARRLIIIRPTVVFGEGNRGNVYNLLRKIAMGRFMMVGPGTNRKSMAYVGNVADALIHGLTFGPGIHVFNYVDTPDLSMNELTALVKRSLNHPTRLGIRVPYHLALVGGILLDIGARLTSRTFPISAIRVKKFCENTQFKAQKIRDAGFSPRYTLQEALERTIRTEFNQVFTKM